MAKDKIFSSEILQNTYNVFRKVREDSYCCMSIAAKSELQCSLVYKIITSDLLSIKLHDIKSASIISAFYRPPNCAYAVSARCVVNKIK